MQNVVYYGVNPPFVGGPQGILSIQTDERLIKNDILQLLLTLPGERVYRPTFGTRIRAMVFENPTPQDLAQLESDIVQQLSVEEPRVTVNAVSVTLVDDQVRIVVDVSPNFSQPTRYLIELGISSAGQIALIR